jgi:putative sterol carrier protein
VLLAGERDPIKALMCGEVKVAKGGLASVVRDVQAFQGLMEAAARVAAG